MKLKRKTGFTLMETMLAASLFGMLVISVVGAFVYSQQSSQITSARVRADFLSEEGLEAVRNIRDRDFQALSDGAYALNLSNNQWTLNQGTETIGIFQRQILISTLGDKSKQVDAVVTWNVSPSLSGAIALSTHLTNWMSETTPPPPSWGNPGVQSLVNLSGSQDGLKVDFSGDYIFFVTEENNGEIHVVNATDLFHPVLSQTVGLAGSKPKNIDIEGAFAYLATENNNAELLVLNLADLAHPTILSTFNLSGGANATGIFVSSEKAFLTRESSGDDEFFIIDITNPNIPIRLGSLNLGTSVYDVFVSGSYAYVASAADLEELQILDVSAPQSPAKLATYNLSGGDNAQTLTGYDHYLFLGQGHNLRIFDISLPTDPMLLASVQLSADIEDIAYDANHSFLFLAVENGPDSLNVIDVSSPSLPTLLGQTVNQQGLMGVAYDPLKDRAYGVGVDNNGEFLILQPLP